MCTPLCTPLRPPCRLSTLSSQGFAKKSSLLKKELAPASRLLSRSRELSIANSNKRRGGVALTGTRPGERRQSRYRCTAAWAPRPFHSFVDSCKFARNCRMAAKRWRPCCCNDGGPALLERALHRSNAARLRSCGTLGRPALAKAEADCLTAELPSRLSDAWRG